MTQEQIFPSPEELSLTTKPKNQRIFNIAQLVLRILVPLFTLAATIATLKSDQTYKLLFGMSFRASYTYSSATRYPTQFFRITLEKSQEMCVLVCVCCMNSFSLFWFHEIYVQSHNNDRPWTIVVSFLLVLQVPTNSRYRCRRFLSPVSVVCVPVHSSKLEHQQLFLHFLVWSGKHILWLANLL